MPFSQYANNLWDDSLEEIKLPEPLALKIFKTTLTICGCDLDLDIKEIYYIYQLAKSLNLNAAFKQNLIAQTSIEVKDNLFLRIINDLEYPELLWLVNNALKVLFHTSKHFVEQEIPYLKKLNRIIKEHNLFDLVSDDLETDAPPLIPSSLLDDELKSGIIKFLIEVTMCDGVWNDGELEIIRDVATQYGLPR